MRIRWQISTIEAAGLSTQSSVAFSPTGRAAVAYHSSSGNALRFAIETESALWDITTVDTVYSDCKPSLAFRFGRPAISYRVGSGAVGGELRYAVYDGGNPGWSIERVAPNADVNSLAFDSSHSAAISYYEPATRSLRLARAGSPGGWVSETVNEGPDVGDFNSLSFVPTTAATAFRGQPAIAYHSRASARLGYAFFNGTEWASISAGTIGTGPRVGRCSLAHSPSGYALIAVAGPLSQVFIFANDSRFGWYLRPIRAAQSGAVASNPARYGERGISYDLDGAVRYSLGTARIGRLLVEAPGKTQAGALIGPFELTSTAFSNAGRPAISYYDTSNYTIKVAIGTIVRTPIDYLSDMLDSLLRFGRRYSRAPAR